VRVRVRLGVSQKNWSKGLGNSTKEVVNELDLRFLASFKLAAHPGLMYAGFADL